MGMTTGARSGPDNGHGQLVMIVTGNCHIRNTDDDIDSLQIRINKFVDWTEKWQVKLNTDKCKVISIHHRRQAYSNTGVEPHYVMNNSSLEEVVEIKDLGVYYDCEVFCLIHLLPYCAGLAQTSQSWQTYVMNSTSPNFDTVN